MDEALGRFGKYQLVKRLAEGGMAEIFLAKQQGPAGFEKLCVIKRILPHLSTNVEFVKMFLDEAQLAAQLSHPNIVQVFDFGEVKRSYYLGMEYLHGEDLQNVLRACRAKRMTVPSQVAASIVSAACDALHFAHTACDENGEPLGIVHRDLSPSNIFLTFQGVVKVLDFGIARVEGQVSHTTAGNVKGKFAYMSPEQVRGEKLDGRSDVFALGLVLYEMLTGDQVFRRDTLVASVNALLTSRVPPVRERNPGIAPELDAIALKALERDLRRRFQSAADMRSGLERFLHARTYVPSNQLVRDFLKGLFGDDRTKAQGAVLSGMRSSARMQAVTGELALVGVAAQIPEEVDEADVEEIGPGGSAGAAEPKTDPAATPRKRRWWPAVAALVVLGAGAGVASQLFGEQLGLGAAPAASANSPAQSGPPAAPAGPTAQAGQGGQAAAKNPTPAPTPVAAPPDVPMPPPPKVATAPTAAPPDAPPAATTRVAPKPRPKPRPAEKSGRLSVNCVPWCHIYVDGRDTGLDSPAANIKLKAGKHRLRVVNPPSGVERELDIDVPEEGEIRQVVKF